MSRSIGPQRGVYKLDQMRSFLENFTATFESVRIEAEEFVEVEVARCGAQHHEREGARRDRGNGSYSFRVHDSKRRRHSPGPLSGTAEALEAAGLSE